MYYGLTPYHYCGNNPVSGSDPSGFIIEWDNEVDNATQFVIENNYKRTATLRKQWKDMKDSKNKVTITLRGTQLGEKYACDENGKLPENINIVHSLNPENASNGIGSDAILALYRNQLVNSSLYGMNSKRFKEETAILGHEGAHVVGALSGTQDDGRTKYLTPKEEVRAMGIENLIRGELKLPYMNYYPSASGPMTIPLGPSIPIQELIIK